MEGHSLSNPTGFELQTSQVFGDHRLVSLDASLHFRFRQPISWAESRSTSAGSIEASWLGPIRLSSYHGLRASSWFKPSPDRYISPVRPTCLQSITFSVHSVGSAHRKRFRSVMCSHIGVTTQNDSHFRRYYWLLIYFPRNHQKFEQRKAL